MCYSVKIFSHTRQSHLHVEGLEQTQVILHDGPPLAWRASQKDPVISN